MEYGFYVGKVGVVVFFFCVYVEDCEVNKLGVVFVWEFEKIEIYYFWL